MKHGLKDLTGKKIGHWLVVEYGGYHRRRSKWKCRCDCGTIRMVFSTNLRRGLSLSCGCVSTQKLSLWKTTHGMSNHRLYGTWYGMMTRCYNPKAPSYKRYGATGVVVCLRWHDVRNFINDMSLSFKEGLTLDRINGAKEYSPSTCKWSNASEQQANTRKRYSRNQTSTYIGVSFHRPGRWRARVMQHKRVLYDHYFDSELDAAVARDRFIILNGLTSFRLNFEQPDNDV